MRLSNVSLVLPASPDLDVVGSALALKTVLREAGKNVTVVSAGPLPKTFLLDGQEDFLPGLVRGLSYVIKLNTSKAPVQDISYESLEDRVEIFVVPQYGELTESDISLEKVVEKPDSLVLLGVQHLEDLGAVFESQPDLFYELPRVNVDVVPTNSLFGSMNVVEASYSSVSELIADVLLQVLPDSVNEFVATCLLAGMIVKTNSFQFPSTSPRLLSLASELVKRGARQQDIVRELFKIRPVSVLQLWGRVLARLKNENEFKFIWSSVSLSDMDKTGAEADSMQVILKDLLDVVSEQAAVAVIVEQESGDAKMYFATTPKYGIEDLSLNLFAAISKRLGRHGVYELAELTFENKTLNQLEEKLLEYIKK